MKFRQHVKQEGRQEGRMAQKKSTKATSKTTAQSDPAPASLDVAMKTFLATALVALPVGYFVGSSVGADTTDVKHSESSETHDSNDDHDHDDTTDAKMHAHEKLNVSGDAVPAIDSLEVTKDPKTGWNLHMHTSSFTFQPEKAGSEHTDGEGHAHLYIDDVKVTRLYGGDYYIGELDEGTHTVRVTLNTNDHRDYAVDDEVVAAEVIVVDDHHADDDTTDDHVH